MTGTAVGEDRGLPDARVDGRVEKLARLRGLAGELRPLSLAGDKRLPVIPALERLLPGGGLQRGSTVEVSGVGATTLLQAVLAGPTRAGSWVAWIGAGAIGWGAASELGVSMERIAVVEVDDARRPAVLAALIDAFDLVVVGPGHRLPPAESRRLEARARERGAVILTLRPESPSHGGMERRSGGGADLRLVCGPGVWAGPGSGWGHLTARRLTVSVEGRRSFDRPRRWDLLLPDPDGNGRVVRNDGSGDVGITGPAEVLTFERRSG